MIKIKKIKFPLPSILGSILACLGTKKEFTKYGKTLKHSYPFLHNSAQQRMNQTDPEDTRRTSEVNFVRFMIT